MASAKNQFKSCYVNFTFFVTMFLVVEANFASSVFDGDDEFFGAMLNVSYRDSITQYFRTETGEIAKYGEGTVGPMAGILISVRSKNGDRTCCSLPLINSLDYTPPPSEPWIALIKRGLCNFDLKVENAFKSNATGVLVYNDKDSPRLEKMKLETRNISAAFTYRWKGEELIELLQRQNGAVNIEITVGKQTPRQTTSLNRTSVLFVSISFIVLMIISLAWLIFYYVQRFRYIHAKDRLSRRLCSAAKKALSKIPTRTLKSGDKEVHGDGECCAVCIEPYKSSEVLRILPCRHEFHRSCIDPWLLEHRTCPMCKMDILKHYGFVGDCCPRGHGGNLQTMHFTGSQESILHMDIEEIVAMDNAELVQRLNQNSSPMHHEHVSHALSPIILSHSSRSSSPQDMLCNNHCFAPGTSHDDVLPEENLCSLAVPNKAGSTGDSSTDSGNHSISQMNMCECDTENSNTTQSASVHLAKMEKNMKTA